MLSRLVEATRSGTGGAVVVRGEAGVGKSALVEAAVTGVPDVRILRCTGTEFETDLAFAGVHQLCAPLLDRTDGLPGPQRAALTVSLGLSSGPAPDPYLVALAVLTLLSDAAREQPIICVITDAQWLDRASARVLAFLARRLEGVPVTVLLELRETARPGDFGSLPTLTVEPLPDREARELLLAVFPAPLDEQVRDRILAEARGNPLALLELAAASDPAGTAGGFGVSTGSESRVESLFRHRLAALPDETRRLLLVAAAEPVGDPVLLWRAAQRLGLPLTAIVPAEQSGLLQVDVRVRFRHPLVRSAAYRAASPEDRRRAHRALADVTERDRDPDRHAWHRAQAAAGPDEDVAAELVDSAGRARLRGGLAASAAFLERAAALSPEPGRRAERLLDAAQSWLDAGAPEEAGGLLGTLDEASLPTGGRARTALLRGRHALSLRRALDATPPLLRAARLLEPIDRPAAREAHLDAVFATLMAGSLHDDPAAVTGAPPPVAADTARITDKLLDGIVRVLRSDRAAGVTLLDEALADTDSPVWTHRPMLAALVALEVWDMPSYESILRSNAERARATGALALLPQTLEALAGASVTTGRFRTADMLHDEATDLSVASCNAPPSYCGLFLHALRGPEPAAVADIGAARREAGERGEGLLVGYTYFATAVLHNGLGDYRRAAAAARTAWQKLPFGFTGMVLRELVEAAVRADDPGTAAEAFAALRERTQASPTAWALGNEACCAALLADDPSADRHYRFAVEQLELAGATLEVARARLLHGEWLRRQRRRTQAREQLLGAHEILAGLGVGGFAERAARELRATGERVSRRREPSAVDELTPQELHVGRLAATGATTKTIAAQLFLSPRTVDAHLRSIYRKLGITSRRELWSTALNEDRAVVA
jgi:DNA-binding CsgD family transcriptional regulator